MAKGGGGGNGQEYSTQCWCSNGACNRHILVKGKPGNGGTAEGDYVINGRAGGVTGTVGRFGRKAGGGGHYAVGYSDSRRRGSSCTYDRVLRHAGSGDAGMVALADAIAMGALPALRTVELFENPGDGAPVKQALADRKK